MDPQHLARLDDDGSVRRTATGTASGSAARTSPEGPEVPASAPVHRPDSRRDRRIGWIRAGRTTTVPCPDDPCDSWPLPVAGIALPRPAACAGDVAPEAEGETWPLLDVDALQLAGAAVASARAGVATAGSAPAVTAAGATPAPRRGRHRRPPTGTRRPALYLAAALVGVGGVAGATAGDSSQTAQADEPVSVAAELGMAQARQPALSEDAAASRLQDMVASRAEREDAEAAAAQLQAEADRAAAAAAAAAAEAARPRAVLPVDGARLSSGFGYRWGTLHAGVDLAAPLGTPEYAAMDGVVVRAGAASGFGLAVYIQHQNGDVTVYGHMQEILVSEGQTVQAGDTIALLGARGQATGPHLHFEVHVGGIDGERIDPLPWLRERGVQI